MISSHWRTPKILQSIYPLSHFFTRSLSLTLGHSLAISSEIATIQMAFGCIWSVRVRVVCVCVCVDNILLSNGNSKNYRRRMKLFTWIAWLATSPCISHRLSKLPITTIAACFCPNGSERETYVRMNRTNFFYLILDEWRKCAMLHKFLFQP